MGVDRAQPLERWVSLAELLRARSRLNATQGDPPGSSSRSRSPGYRTRASQIVVDFERAESPVSIEIEPIGDE